MRVAIESIGCKLNQAEAEQLGREFGLAGCRLVSASEEADIYILNTCTVTHVADRKCRNWLRQARRKNPDALLIATGCYAERASADIQSLDNVIVVDNKQKAGLVGWLRSAGYLNGAGGSYGIAPAFRTRAFIKIQDGCTRFCSYCIVPLVRGAEKSLPLEEIIGMVRQRAAEGYREVVLTGTEVGSYSHGGCDLGGLLGEVLARTDIVRLRLSSLQPKEITPGLLALWKDRRLCRHFHLSLQSGSDAVLQKMRRGYRTAEYERAVRLIKEDLPDVSITTDVIVGFPGETVEDFGETCEVCGRLEFARIHVFPFSPRPGTAAAEMLPRVPEKQKKAWSQRLIALGEESSRRFRVRFLGQALPVLWEKETGGKWSGLTDNYIRVYTASERDLTGRVRPARLAELQGDGVRGELLPVVSGR